jgi:hypothetical protein
MSIAPSVLLLIAQMVQPTPTVPTGLPLVGAEAEDFLRNAEIVELKRFDTRGVTLPRRATLTDGRLTLRAVFKTINEFEPRKKLADGRVLLNFRDSYKHEIAAYELATLLGLDIVPPCVERSVRDEVGALCLWVEGAMTEWERSQERQIAAPDPADWNRQMYTIRLFLQLIADTDFQNISNLLVDSDFRVYKIDATRAFGTDKKLRSEGALDRFSWSLLEALRGLTPEMAKAALEPWLTKGQIKAVLQRRDRILELADRRVAEQGEDAVLFP